MPELFNYDKLYSLTHYIIAKFQDVGKKDISTPLVSTVLHLADFKSYSIRGKAITGAEYMMTSDGPIICYGILDGILGCLRSHRNIAFQNRLSKGIKGYIALQDPDLSWFSQEELAIIDQVMVFPYINYNQGYWQFTKAGDNIPYSLCDQYRGQNGS